MVEKIKKLPNSPKYNIEVDKNKFRDPLYTVQYLF